MEKVTLKFNYSLRKVGICREPPCQECALCVRGVFCMSRKNCPYSPEKPFVYKFEGVEDEKVA